MTSSCKHSIAAGGREGGGEMYTTLMGIACKIRFRVTEIASESRTEFNVYFSERLSMKNTRPRIVNIFVKPSFGLLEQFSNECRK